MAWVKKIRIIYLLAVVIVLVAVSGIIFGVRPPAKLPSAQLLINDQIITVEVAATAAARYNGLSRRPSLCPDCGMWFKFSTSSDLEFVMRGMNFPLDIIFINNNKIIKIAADLPPAGPPPDIIYSSDGLADQVLEVRAGYAARTGIKVGDAVREIK